MAISSIAVKNYKCFEDIKVNLGNFNVIIGPNASGKSCFIQLLKFLKDLDYYGLSNAISLQGGVEFFRNINIGNKTNFILEVSFKDETRMRRTSIDNPFEIEQFKLDYYLEISFYKQRDKYKVEQEKITQNLNFYRLHRKNKKLEEKDKIGEGLFITTRSGNRVSKKIKIPKSIDVEESEFYPSIFKDIEIPPTESLTTPPISTYPFPFELLSDISIYDFDPRLAKKAIPFTGRSSLEEDGSNIAIVLNRVLRSKENERKFNNIINDLLPFFRSTKIDKLTDKSFIFSIKEQFLDRNQFHFPSSFISDGTINIIALIIALFFEGSDIISIFEEPERNLHPSLISKLIGLMKEASKNKQIIITTHNPEIIKHSPKDQILFISRNKDGYSKIFRPVEKWKIKEFLKNEIGLDELFIQNLIR